MNRYRPTGKLMVNDIEIKQDGIYWFVRISIGGHMYFDSPKYNTSFAAITFKNLIERLEI